jgi:hypothetical protein
MCLEFSERGGTYPGLPVRKDIEFLGLPKFSFDHPGHSLLSVHFWQYPNDTKRKDMTEEQVAASITESDRNLAEEATQEAKAGSDPYVSSIIKDESSESDSHLFSSSDRSEVPPELPPIECPICLETLPQSQMIQLDCKHKYCSQVCCTLSLLGLSLLAYRTCSA